MAVRVLDENRPTTAHLVAVPNVGRRATRLERRRWYIVGIVSLAAPLVIALLVVGIVR